jgi:hypothetical protein
MGIVCILRSMASRDAGRLDLALTRAFFLVATFALLLPTAVIHGGPMTVVVLFAWMLHWQVLVTSLFLVFILAGRLGGDSVGDFRSGLLDLLLMTGLKPWRWLVVRVVQMWIGFASVWIVRVPLLIFLISVGGVSLEKLVVVELLLLTAFLLLSGLALVTSFTAKSRQQVWGGVLLPTLLWEFLLHAPRIATGAFTKYYGLAVSATTSDWLDTMAATGLTSRILAAMRGPLELAECLPTFALYGVLSAVVLWRFLRNLNAVTQGRVAVPANELSGHADEQHGPQRASRRCWDDALAWQAFCIHGHGKLVVQVKCIVYTLLAVGLLVSIPLGYHLPMFVLTAATCFVVMLIAVGKPSDCLSREIRDETMPTLLLTPNSMADYYSGWQRGAWRLAWPDVVLAAVLALSAFALDPIAPPIVVSVVVAILFAGPFMMLSPLVPFTFNGVATGLGLTFLFVVIVGLCIFVGAVFHPVFVPLILVPLVSLFNYHVRRHVLPYWMERKISAIV